MKKIISSILSIFFIASSSIVMRAEAVTANDNQGTEYSFDVKLDEENGKYTTIIAFDDEGNAMAIIVELDDNSLVRTSSYAYWKGCGDNMGCPGTITGQMNGYNFTVYRQKHNWNGSQAYYSGWLYD